MNPRNERRSAAAPAAWAGFWILLAAAPAAAQDLSGSFDAEAFRPAPGAEDGFVVQRSTPQEHLGWSVRLYLDYAHAPLVLRQDGEIVERIIEHRLNAHLLGAIGFWDILEVGLGLPFVLVQTGETSLGLDDLSAAAVGDLRLDLKAAWPERFGGVFGVALGATVRFGTGDAQAFSGEGVAGFDPRLILDVQTPYVGLALDLGYRLRENASLATLPVEDELTWAFGAATPLPWYEDLSLLLELFGATAAADPFGALNRSPLELQGGARWTPPCGLVLSAGAGGGLTRGYTAPDVRVFLEVGYAPAVEPGPPDRDGDGIPDETDRCPDDPEDEDDWQDDDGCPDPDNDGDGILDGDDDCPNEPESENGIRDDDGCPERDRDGDTIIDDVDQCPDQAEDDDDFADEDGCPDPDNDGDRIVDGDDQCPVEPETVNEYEDTDGCPDFARRDAAEIAVLKPILFKTNSDEILPESYPVLADVAAILTAHPDLRIRIEGHTDDRGSDDHNLDLSRRRAASVVRFLVERHGIAAERLSSEGYGESHPIADNRTSEGRARNRRVVFQIVP